MLLVKKNSGTAYHPLPAEPEQGSKAKTNCQTAPSDAKHRIGLSHLVARSLARLCRLLACTGLPYALLPVGNQAQRR